MQESLAQSVLYFVNPEIATRMRFDEASTLYGEFGAFYTGLVGSVDEVLAAAIA